MHVLYSLGWLLVSPLVVVYLLWRSIRQPDYRRHWGERAGLHPRRTDRGPLIWLHAVSVGETRAAQPLVRALADAHPEARLLVTCMTPTGRRTAHELYGPMLGERFVQAYLPYDHPWAQRRFLRAWRPAFGVLIETELWPALLAQARRERVPVALVNARLSERSLARGLRQRRLVLPAARGLACVLAQSDADAARIARLGRPADAVTGNLKFDTAPRAPMLALGRGWRARLGRPVVLCASTRDGEEALLRDAWRARGARTGGALLAIVPRHPQRFETVAREALAAGWRVARRAALEDAAFDGRDADLLLGDSMGELDAWYALASCAVIGGSLLPFGSQNLIEGCAAGCPMIVGPSTFNFEEAAARAVEAGAARRVADAAAAVEAALALLAAPDLAERMGRAGLAFAAEHRGATERTLTGLAELRARL